MTVLVGREAPMFEAPAVLADGEVSDTFSLQNHLEGSYGVLFFYPLDFTFVCPSELVALDHRRAAFEERNTKVVAVSIDSVWTHRAWRTTSRDEGGIGDVWFPLVSDLKHEIVRTYGIENDDGVALRGVFLIDRGGIVRTQVVHDDPIGRSVDEVLRTVDALQFHEEHGSVCPAGWKRGDAGMTASTAGVAAYLREHGKEL